MDGGTDLEPPLNLSGILVVATTLGVSADFTHAMVATNRKLTPDAVEDGPERANLYVKDIATGTYTLIATAPSGLATFISEGGTRQFFAGAPDFSWVVSRGRVPLLPGVPAGTLYRWSKADGLEAISNRPDGTPEPVDVDQHSRALRSVAVDGSRVYFANISQPEEGLYDDGQVAYWLGINKSEEVGKFVWRNGSVERATETLLTNTFSIAASPDGRYFSYANEGNVYLFDSESGSQSCVSCLADGTLAGGYLTPTGRPELPADLADLLLGGVVSLVARYVDSNRAERLPEATTARVEYLLIPYIGGEETSTALASLRGVG